MSWKSWAGLLGLVLFVGGSVLAIYLGVTALEARELEQRVEGPVTGEPATCADAMDASAALDARVMAEDETQALTVLLENGSSEACEVTVELSAPFFSFAPPEPRRTITVTAGANGALAWVITPQRTGTYDIVVTIGEKIFVLGVTVTNILGLTARQARVLSALGTFLGPMLTAPWWVEQWQRWRKEQAPDRREREEEEEEKAIEAGVETPEVIK